MSRRGWLAMVAALAVWAAWTVYAQSTGPSAADTPKATQQCATCPMPSCGPAGCCGGCAACPAFVDQDNDGVCDVAGTCAKRANVGCRGPKNCGGQWPTVLMQPQIENSN